MRGLRSSSGMRRLVKINIVKEGLHDRGWATRKDGHPVLRPRKGFLRRDRGLDSIEPAASSERAAEAGTEKGVFKESAIVGTKQGGDAKQSRWRGSFKL